MTHLLGTMMAGRCLRTRLMCENPRLMLPDSPDPEEATHDYDSALELTGYSSFHYWLAFVCGWANASDAVEILCISFLLPSAGGRPGGGGAEHKSNGSLPWNGGHGVVSKVWTQGQEGGALSSDSRRA